MVKRKYNRKDYILPPSPPIVIVRNIPYECIYCGEDREEHFVVKRGKPYCTVCGAQAIPNEENRGYIAG